jgi:hypothetical protein
VEEEFRNAFGVAYGEHGARRILPDYHVKMSDADLDALADAIWHAWLKQQNAGP